MKPSLSLIFLILFSIMSSAELSPITPTHETSSDNNSVFNSALSAYQNKDYKEAEKLFLEVSKEKPESPEVLHNLGLTYFAKDDKARALAYFRSLINIEPRNFQVYKTIEYLEAKLTNKDFSHDRTFIEDINLTVLQWFKLPEILILHFSVLTVFGIIFVRRLAIRKKRALQNEIIMLFNPQLYAGFALVIIFTFLTIIKISFITTDQATIITKNRINLKSGPSESSADLYELFEGFKVDIEATVPEWSQITYQDQYTGWVKNSNLWKHIK